MEIQADDYDPNNSWVISHNNNRFIPTPVMDSEDQLIFVSGSFSKSEAHKLDFFGSKRQPCLIPQELIYNSREYRRTHILGNGKVIVTMLNSKAVRNRPLQGRDKREWILTIIDSNDCSYKHIKFAGPKESLINVFPYRDTFDLLIHNYDRTKGPLITKVFRYHDSGELVNFSADIPNTNFLRPLEAKSFDSMQGYYNLESNREENFSIINKFDANFKLIKSYKFDLPKHYSYNGNSVSMNYGHFSICYVDDISRKKLECFIIDGDFNKESDRIRLSFKNKIYHINMKSLPDGDAVVVYGINYDENFYNIALQRIGRNGKAGKVIDLGKILAGLHDIHVFVKNDGSICVVVLTDDSSYTKFIENF